MTISLVETRNRKSFPSLIFLAAVPTVSRERRASLDGLDKTGDRTVVVGGIEEVRVVSNVLPCKLNGAGGRRYELVGIIPQSRKLGSSGRGEVGLGV